MDNQDNRFCFLDFFKEGNAGRTVFHEFLVPFLSLDDLVAGAAVCRQMNVMCRTYTMVDILGMHPLIDDIITREDLRIGLGKFIIGAMSPTYDVATTLHHRGPRQTVTNLSDHGSDTSDDGASTDSFSSSSQAAYFASIPRIYIPPTVLPEMEEFDAVARLYHPSSIPEILSAIAVYLEWKGIEFDRGTLRDSQDEQDKDDTGDETELLAEPNTLPTLVSATFGRDGGRSVDVTAVVRYLIMKQGNTRLVMQQRRNGHTWWYTSLFGDPHPRRTKTLKITERLEDGTNKTWTFRENAEVDLSLRAEV